MLIQDWDSGIQALFEVKHHPFQDKVQIAAAMRIGIQGFEDQSCFLVQHHVGGKLQIAAEIKIGIQSFEIPPRFQAEQRHSGTD